MTMQTAYHIEYPMSKVVQAGPYRAQGLMIQRRRKQLKLSQGQVSEKYGSQQSYISDIERGYVNFASSDISWFQRMSSALNWSVDTLMQELGVTYIKAGEGDLKLILNDKVLLKTPLVGYASIIIKVTLTGDAIGVAVREKSLVVAEAVAQLNGLAGLEVRGNYLNAASVGQIAVYADVKPEADEVVAIVLDGVAHLAYFISSSLVSTDRPINTKTAIEFKPDSILGVVQSFTSADKPRRISYLS